MPQKKKQKGGRNGFYYFMLEIQKELNEKGRRLPLAEVSEVASPRWQAMTPEDKKYYNDMAQVKSSKNADDPTKKFTSLGVSYAEVDARQRELEEAYSIMIATIKNTVANLDPQSTLKTHIFFLCHCNYYFRSDENFYYPAEFAMAAFSLELGVIDTIQFFVDPGKFPLGLKYEAADWSARTHGIPVCDPTWKEGLRDPLEMYRRVRAFMQKYSVTTEVPPIYTMFETTTPNTLHSPVKNAFKIMCEAANEDTSLFRVYCLSNLFYEIRKVCTLSDVAPSVVLMKSELEKDVFSYAIDLGCYFHEEKDLSVYCSLSIVTRWVFTVCDHCCKHLGITLMLGRHVPKDTDLSESSNYFIESESVKENTASNEKPITIIDHGWLKEQRAAEKRAQDMHLSREAEKIRNPRPGFSSKIGARFNQGNFAGTSQVADEAGWVEVKGKTVGRGRGILKEEITEPMWPVSGRGRALLNRN